MKRTRLQRRTSIRPSREPIPRESPRRQAERTIRSEIRDAALRRANYRCELRDVVPEVKCWGRLDVDEIAQRGVAPGGHLDIDNVQVACRAHHDWKGEHRDEAEARGVRIPGYAYPASKIVPRPSAVDAMIAAQDEAARRFEENMGRKSTDPSPPGTMAARMVGGRMQVVTSGYDRNPDTADLDFFARAGIDRVHINTAGEVERADTPTEMWGRYPGGTPLAAAVGEVLAAAEQAGMLDPAPEAIEADAVDPE